jgi:hypothetical protein
MGQSHRSSESQLNGPEWVDALLVVGAVVLVVTRTSLAAHPVLFGVVSAFLVGMTVQRLFAWMERPERASASPATAREEPRHAARAA